MSYSLLHLQDVGYGKGFDDNLSRYDPESRLLTLSNGEQYRLEGEASEPAFCPPAPLHIRLKMLNGALWIYYKNGAVEQLIIPQAKAIAQKYYLLNRVFSPAGHEILFTYIVVNGRLRLAQIKDAQQSLVEIKWPSLHQVDGQPPAPNHVILTVWPGLAQSYSLLLQKEQGKLTRVSQCDKNSIDNARCRAGALCEIGYDSRDRLTSLRLPGGINEDFVYCADDAVRPLPCMASHTTRVTDNQRELYRQTQTFQFTDVDFLTANAPLSRPDMLSPGKNYSSKITIRRDNRSPLGPAAPETGSEIITRRYDSYHRLVSEKHQTKITMNNQLKESEYTLILSYRAPVDATTTTPLAQLARTYCLPTRKEEHWRIPPIVNSPQRPDQQPQKKTITHYNYDADGNLTLCVYPDGSQFTVNYFNADGSDSDCPADPLGFRRFAAEVSYEIPPGDIPTTQIRRIYYHYGALSCHRPSVLPHDTLVLCHKITYAIYNFPLKAPAADAGRAPAQDTAIKNVRDVPSRVDVKTLEVSYYDEPEATFGSRHGRLKSQRMTYTGEPEKTVVSKNYFWEKRSARDKTPTDYELVCTCHFSVSHTRTEPEAAPETAAAVPQGSTSEDDAPQMTPARTANEAQQTLTTTSIWSLPDYHLITTIDAQDNQTDYRYQNNDLDFFLTRHAQTPCAAIQCRTIRYDLQQNSLVHISETDSLGNGVHRYIDGFGRLHRKTYCSARRADNPVTLEERRYDGAGRLIEATLNDWHIAATTLAPSQQIAQHRGEYYYDEWGQLNVFLHHDGERGQYHLIDNAIFDDRQTREQFPYDVASRSVDLRACASGVIEEHYDIVNRPLKLLRETRSAITLGNLEKPNQSLISQIKLSKTNLLP
ncbi:hypothetical protein [Sodalis praecaptivus]|uniref:hypothetical protein n=1 Tax=Sodalis praecaptivus TaxID=1239307 RepID=UPI0031F7EC43